MQQQNSNMYMPRRFGFLYQGTLSSATMRVRTSADRSPTLRMAMIGLAIGSVGVCLEMERETRGGGYESIEWNSETYKLKGLPGLPLGLRVWGSWCGEGLHVP